MNVLTPLHVLYLFFVICLYAFKKKHTDMSQKAVYPDKELSHVLIMIAMEAEAQPLLDHLKLEQVPVKVSFARFLVYTGQYKGKQLTVVTNGKCSRFNVDKVGTTPGKRAYVISISLSLITVYEYEAVTVSI